MCAVGLGESEDSSTPTPLKVIEGRGLFDLRRPLGDNMEGGEGALASSHSVKCIPGSRESECFLGHLGQAE